MQFPRMSFATFAKVATISGLVLFATAYGLLLVAATMIHPAAVLVVVAGGMYYLSTFAFIEAKVAQARAMERAMQDAYAKMGAAGGDAGYGDDSAQFDMRQARARERMN